MPLTDIFIRNLKPTGKPEKHFDGNGLYLFLSATGGKSFRMDYRFNGKRKTLSLGKYPDVSLKMARERCASARTMLAEGHDPSEQMKRAQKEEKDAALKLSRTFTIVAAEWLKTKESVYAASNIKKKKWLLSLFADQIGDFPIANLLPQDILSAIRPIEAKGNIVTAHKMAETAGQVCRYARTCGYTVYNPADGLKEVLQAIKTKHYACLKDPSEVAHLLRCIDSYHGKNESVEYALKILPYLPLRSMEIRGGRCQEIDLDNAIWRIPASRRENPKDGGGMKMRVAHEVPLPRQVVELFKELRAKSYNEVLCFPSPHSAAQCISDMALLNALRRMGFTKEEMTIHGFRGTFSTLMNEMKLDWGFDPDVIETQLAHKDTNTVRGAYNHATYMQKRREMMQKWADYLDSVKVSV